MMRQDKWKGSHNIMCVAGHHVFAQELNGQAKKGPRRRGPKTQMKWVKSESCSVLTMSRALPARATIMKGEWCAIAAHLSVVRHIGCLYSR
ncbi:hypothetical protein CNX70_07250 [Janthinobacterium svalbardensis]|uniref:Uncharacterized protein n=1 Tax=Janthinobacterium svalbardensis TaxID=368607 RepID=A0A290WTT0_9BURK|nr:hypothetical protein CNX70_07250 [Janthinobacterium svalbardensis]